jgi:hypothetical protein
MRPISYVSDGERDHQMLPPLVRQVIGEHEVASFRAWHDIQLQGSFGRGRNIGYGRKLAFVIRLAESEQQGVVATVDRDSSDGGRLRELRDARSTATVPVAVGEAIPHGEAWLIDDLVPLRACLGLDPQAPRPDMKDPKGSLHQLIRETGRSDLLEVIGEIAAMVVVERCQRARDTGLAAFVSDLKAQIGHG